MSEEFDQGTESDLRRRAAWLLGMLVVVAALVVTIMVVVLGGSDGGDNTVAAPTDGATNASVPPVTVTPSDRTDAPSSSSGAPKTESSSTARSSSSSTSTSPSGTPSGASSCPGSTACVLDGDKGGAADAINAYRTQNGQKAVPIAPGDKAQQCALANGSGCSGGWAETQVPKLDGDAAVQKIRQFGKLLDPDVTSIEIGWAYDPGAKQYYFALVRQD